MLSGSYLLFAVSPVWVIALFLVGVLWAPIQILRNRKEGMPYQVAWSALFGDVGLAIIPFIAWTILQRDVLLPAWMVGGGFEVTAVTLAVCVGAWWAHSDWNTQVADRYHHIVVAPVLTYLMFTLLPVIAIRGDWIEICATILLLIVWGRLIVFDTSDGRMNQRQWLQTKMGVVFTNEGWGEE